MVILEFTFWNIFNYSFIKTDTHLYAYIKYKIIVMSIITRSIIRAILSAQFLK
jgi:hypothetical protein